MAKVTRDSIIWANERGIILEMVRSSSDQKSSSTRISVLESRSLTSRDKLYKVVDSPMFPRVHACPLIYLSVN